MPAGSRPSYQELAALVVAQADRIARLEAEVADLRRQLGQNSQNSSRPPSSDSPFVKPARKSLRRKSGRKPGGLTSEVSDGGTLTAEEIALTLEETLQGIRDGNIVPTDGHWRLRRRFTP